MRFRQRGSLIGSAALVLAVTWCTSADAAFPNKCGAGKEKCVAKKAVGLLYCHTKAEAWNSLGWVLFGVVAILMLAMLAMMAAG